jgi:hypothetical protein
MPVEDVKRLGRSTQGVIVMRLREGETVSTLAPVIDDATDESAETDAMPAAPGLELVLVPEEEPSDEDVGVDEDDEPFDADGEPPTD